jgi:hypothetical protein
MTRRGRMMVVMLDDGTAQVEISVFNELFEKHREKLKEDSLLVVAGKVQSDEFSGGLRVSADELMDLETLRNRHASLLKLFLNGQADARRLEQLLGPYRASGNGSCQVLVEYENGTALCKLALGESWRVRPDTRLISELGPPRTGECRGGVQLPLGPAHLAGLARQEAPVVAQPAVRPALVRVDPALLGEEAGQLGIAGVDLLARGLWRACDRKAAAVGDREVDEAALELRHAHLRSEVGAFGEAEADLAAFAPGEAQERSSSARTRRTARPSSSRRHSAQRSRHAATSASSLAGGTSSASLRAVHDRGSTSASGVCASAIARASDSIRKVTL